MNILYLSHRIPFPPDKGDKIRSFHQIDHLARNHRLYVATFLDTADDERHVAALRERCVELTISRRNGLGTLVRAGLALSMGRSISVHCFHSATVAREVRRWIKSGSIDAALAFSSSMAQYLEHVTEIPRVIDFVDVDSEKWRAYANRAKGPAGWLYRLEAGRLGKYDAMIGRTFDRSIFVSEAEAALFQRLAPEVSPTVIANGVDLDFFRPQAPDEIHSGIADVLFVGMMNYLPNTDAVAYFVRDIWPRIRVSERKARFVIVGREPTASVRSLARAPEILVTGGVPDVRPHLARASVAVAPFRIARGLQNKVLEAMASGLPVVGTSLAFQGISAGESDGVEMADTPEAFARAVTRLLADPDLRRTRGLAARRYVERHHRWSDQGAALESVLLELHERKLRRA